MYQDISLASRHRDSGDVRKERGELMKSPWCSIFAVILAGLLLVTANAPSDTARRSARRWNLERGYLHPAWGLRFCPRRLTDRRRSRAFRRLRLSSLRCCWSWGAIRVTLIRGSQSASGSGRLSYSSGAGRRRTSGGRVFRHVVRDAACGLLLINSTSAQDCGSDCVAQRLRTWR